MNFHAPRHPTLCLFGLPMLSTSSGDRVDLSPSGWRLIAALAAAPDEGIARAALAGIVSPAGKLGTLRKLLFEVRRTLDAAGLSLIEGEGDLLRLSDDVYCDLRDLRAPASQRAPHEIYRGAFFDVRFAFKHEPWTVWLAERRHELLDLYRRKAGEALAAAGADPQARAREARHLLRFAPDHAGATTALMLEAACISETEKVQRRFGALQAGGDIGAQPGRRATGSVRRFAGASQGGLAFSAASEEMDLPTVYVSTPAAGGAPRAERLLRSLLTDVTIGLCRASLFRVIASDRVAAAVPLAAGTGRTRSYRVATSLIDHVLGPQVVFTLLSHPDGQVLWTERVEAAAELTVSAYNLLTVGVLRSLVEHIKDVELGVFRLDADPGAYALYLAGYSSLGSLDLAELRRGRRHLRRALSQSPDFAPTPSALARSLQLEWLVTGRGERDLLTDARGHALHAIAADPHEARGFKALAFCDLFENKSYDTALENYARAEQLNRNYAELIAEHANCLLHCGMLEESLVKINYAMQLNPEFGDMYRWTKASTCFFLSQYDQVLLIIEQMNDPTPALRLLAATHALMGNQEAASLSRMSALEAYPAMTIEGWTKTMAMKDPHHVQLYSEGLARAGFS